MSFSVSLYNLVATISMTAYHLRKSEIEYELQIRNISTEGLAGDLRRKLSQCFTENTAVVETCVKALNVNSELKICKEKLKDLSALVEDYEGTYSDNEYQRISARLWHLLLRIDRIPISDSAETDPEAKKDQEDRRKELKTQTQKLIDEFKKSESPFQHGNSSVSSGAGVTDPQMEQSPHIKGLPQIQISSLGTREPTRVTEPIVPAQFHGMGENIKPSLEHHGQRQETRSVPVYKWGLQFDNSSGQSIGSFLQRVEELRRARGITETQLFNSAVDLFSGSVLVWYRSTVGRITTWQNLCKEMKVVFQTPDYDDMLTQEIMSRRQGEQESIDIYIASMEGLYSRLSSPVSEENRLKQMLKNLNRYLQEKLCMFPIVSIEQLRILGRKAELGRLRAANTQAMSSSAPVLEPDLAYRRTSLTKQRIGEVSYSKPYRSLNKGKCWNCSEDGHRHNRCTKPKTMFCYGCGAKNIKKSDCSSCRPKNV